MEFKKKKISETKTIVVERDETDREFVRRLVNEWCESSSGMGQPLNQCPPFSKADTCKTCKLRLKYPADYPDYAFGAKETYEKTDCPLIIMNNIMRHIQKHMRKD